MSGRPSLELAVVMPIVRRALHEDVGDGDITSLWTVRESATARAEIVARAVGVVAGLSVAEAVFTEADPSIEFESTVEEGASVAPENVVARVSGPARGILTGERTALNFLQRMSGIATSTAQYVDAVRGTGVGVLDTRKTAPGLRALDKYAVAVGGGTNHRMGLFDMVLIKENHIQAADGVGPAVLAAKSAMAREGKRVQIEVEVKTPAELEDAIAARADWVMLDNMDVDSMRRAAARVRQLGEGRPTVEASGNVTLDSIREVAETGVDLISIGALTHSVKALDLSLLFRWDV